MTIEIKPDSASLLQAARQSLVAAQEALNRDIQELANAISAAEKRRSELANNPISFNDYLGLLRDSIQHRGEQFARTQMLGANDGRHPDSRMPLHEFVAGKAPQFEAVLGLAPTANALCFYFPDMVYARLEETLRKAYADNWGSRGVLPIAERLTLIERLDGEIADLKRQKSELQVRQQELLRPAY